MHCVQVVRNDFDAVLKAMFRPRIGASGYRGDAGDAGAAPSRLRRPRNSERAVAGRRGGGATPAHCGWFAMARSNVAGYEYQYGGGT